MSHKCDLCDKIFVSKSQLERHLNRQTPCDIIKESTDCTLCNRSFPCMAKLIEHNKSQKHKKNYNKANNKQDIKEQIDIEFEKENTKQEYEQKLSDELKAKEDIIINMSKEINDLKFDFNDNIKSVIQEEVLELVPIFDKLTTHKVLNKIDINNILSQYNRLLSITDLLYIINYDLNKLYIDKFWNNIESDSWIYLDEELIQWFGYKEIKESKRILINFIKQSDEDEYKILNNEDYKKFIMCDTHMMVCAAHTIDYHYNYQHIYVSSDCFKRVCFKVGTKKSEDIINYYIEVEKIFKFYIKYTLEFNKYELEKSKLIKNRYINKSELKINSKLYLITNHYKAKENIFKFGSTNDEKARKSVYNTGHVEADKFFYAEVYDCYDAISLEKRIAKLLINFKIPNESEMYQLHFKALDNIIRLAIKNDMQNITSINMFLADEYDNYLNLESVKF